MALGITDLQPGLCVEGAGDVAALPAPANIAHSLDDLQAECDAMRGYSPDWYTKMMHRVPPARVVDRVRYIVEQCQGKRVLHLGCNWPPGYLHKAIEKVATVVMGVDIAVPRDHHDPAYCRVDLDQSPVVLPAGKGDFHLVVCAEILEHLGNPSNLLAELKHLACPLLITVPNAFSKTGYYHVTGGIESVNPEHVAYYSYHTLKVLVERYGYTMQDWCWYNGRSNTAEGLIMVVKETACNG